MGSLSHAQIVGALLCAVSLLAFAVMWGRPRMRTIVRNLFRSAEHEEDEQELIAELILPEVLGHFGLVVELQKRLMELGHVAQARDMDRLFSLLRWPEEGSEE